MPVQPGIAGGPNLPVGLSDEDVGASLRRRFGLPVPLPMPRDQRQPAVAANGAPPGVADPRSPYPIDPATGEALVPPEDQATGNQPSGEGAPKPLATPQSKVPAASWTPPPASDPVAADIHSKGSYLSQALKDTEAPSWSQPNQFINTIHGDGPMIRHTLGSSDPRYWSAQYPGTPENEEVQGQLRKRSALAAALRTLPEATKLQEAKLHLQAQQEGAHKAMIENWWRNNPLGTADQFQNFLDTVLNSDQLGREKMRQPGQGPGQPQPGLQGDTTQPGIGQGGTPSGAGARLQKTREEAVRLNAATPTEESIQLLLKKIPTYTDVETAIKDFAGEPLIMGNPQARTRVVKELLNQGKAGIPDLDFALHKYLVRQAHGGRLLGFGQDQADIGGVPVRYEPGDGIFSKTRYFVDSPLGYTQPFSHSNLPGGKQLAGLAPVMEPWTRAGILDNARQGNTTGVLLRAIAEHRQAALQQAR